MIGKVVGVNEFELKYGNKQRKINAYACFKEKKYNTTFLIFSFVGQNKLYYCNAHVKTDKIVIIKFNQDKSNIVYTFINDLFNDKLENYEIIDLDNHNVVEIISFNNIDFDIDKLIELDNKTIPKPENNEVEKVSNYKLVIFIVISLILLILFSYIFINREKIFKNEKVYECIINYEQEELDVKVKEIRSINFINNKMDNMDIKVDYLFNDRSNYLEFKRNKKEYNYNLYKDGSYKYVDDQNVLKFFYNSYNENTLNNKKLNDIIKELENKGYKCNLIEKE